MKEQNHGVHGTQCTPLEGAVIQLPGLQAYNAYNVIGAFVSASKAQAHLREYLSSAAELVHGIALGIERNHPEWMPSEVLKAFQAEFDSAIQKHIVEGNLDDSWEKRQKPLNQAYRKIKGALEFGGKLSVLNSCSKCEKYNLEQGELARKNQLQNQRLAEAVAMAQRDGCTVEEAVAKLEAPKMEVVADNTTTTTSGDPRIASILNEIEEIGKLSPQEKAKLLQSFEDKIKAVKKSLTALGPMLKQA